MLLIILYMPKTILGLMSSNRTARMDDTHIFVLLESAKLLSTMGAPILHFLHIRQSYREKHHYGFIYFSFTKILFPITALFKK